MKRIHSPFSSCYRRKTHDTMMDVQRCSAPPPTCQLEFVEHGRAHNGKDGGHLSKCALIVILGTDAVCLKPTPRAGMHSWSSHEGKRDVRGSMGARKHRHHKYLAKPCHRGEHPKPPAGRLNRCRSLCCGSTRLSVSSSTGDDAGSSTCAAAEAEHDAATSRLAHAMVQARLEQMIVKGKESTAARGVGGRCVVVVAVDKESHDPRWDFRESILEVITSNGMKEPRELRNLLKCYMSMNRREHRTVILEAFHDVCASLFTCKF